MAKISNVSDYLSKKAFELPGPPLVSDMYDLRETILRLDDCLLCIAGYAWAQPYSEDDDVIKAARAVLKKLGIQKEPVEWFENNY